MEHTVYKSSKDLIAREVSSLLKEQDCVIIPGFGGLVSRYAPAKVHPVSHVFQAPHKHILFNRSLNTDDGLLVNRLMPLLGLSYAETRHYILSTSEAMLNRIMAGERTDLQKVGTFITDPERNIQFKQDFTVNHLPEAFGLYSIQASPVSRSASPERRQPIVMISRGLTEEVLPAPQKKRNRKLWRAIPAAAAVFAAAWLLIPNMQNDGISGLNFFPSAQTETFGTLALHPTMMPQARVSVLPEIDGQVFNADNAKIFVVAGCYTTKNNADGMVNYLNEKGFDSYILDRTPAGLYRVVYGDYKDVSSASEELDAIRKGLNEEAWLLIL
jgi:nucleoid DNA-binding protein